MAFLPPPAGLAATRRRISRAGTAGRAAPPRAVAMPPPTPSLPSPAASSPAAAGGLTRRAVLSTAAAAAAAAAAARCPPPAAAATPTQSPAARVQAADAVAAVAAGSTPAASPPPPPPPAGGATSEYVGPLSLGYSFRYPTTWSANKKPIKTHLSEVIVSAPKGSSASVGLVVDGPLKIGSIEEFGTPDAVGAKVLALERKKDSTKDVRLVRTASETLGVGGGAAAAAGVGQPAGLGNGVAYIVEYVVDSSRGVKHFVAKATVAAGQLYVMTATCKEDEFEAARGGLETVLASLRVAPKV